jgi:uncharacterized protein (DUF697 family)
VAAFSHRAGVRPVASGLVWFRTPEKKPRGLYKIAYITVYRLQAQIDCQPKKESTVVSKKEQKAQESTVVSEKEQKAQESTVVGENELKALKTVKNYMWWSMGAGLIPFPWVDMVAVSGVQLKMLSEISKIYDVPFQLNRGKAVVGSLIGSIVPGAISYGAALTLLKGIPLVGIVGGATMALTSGATAWALGKVFIQHFESGGTFLDLNPEEVREYFKAQFEEGRKMATTMGTQEKAEVPA